MTYTVIGRDPTTGELGIGIATYSLAVGASCPYIRPGAGAVSTQAATYPGHGPTLLDLIEAGMEPADAFDRLRASDRYFEYRQIGVVTARGQVHVHTGTEVRDWAGCVTGEGWLVMGNVLAGDHVTNAMAKSFGAGAGSTLGARLMNALEAGRDAGGQCGLGDKHLPERSAVVTVYGTQPFAELDLRVDDHPNAVSELRRIFDRFTQVDGYYRDRANTPADTPPQDQWMAEHGLE